HWEWRSGVAWLSTPRPAPGVWPVLGATRHHSSPAFDGARAKSRRLPPMELKITANRQMRPTHGFDTSFLRCVGLDIAGDFVREWTQRLPREEDQPVRAALARHADLLPDFGGGR